jgi:hypothetical protein
VVMLHERRKGCLPHTGAAGRFVFDVLEHGLRDANSWDGLVCLDDSGNEDVSPKLSWAVGLLVEETAAVAPGINRSFRRFVVFVPGRIMNSVRYMSLFEGSGASALGRRLIRFGFRVLRGEEAGSSSSVVSTNGVVGSSGAAGVTGLLVAEREY